MSLLDKRFCVYLHKHKDNGEVFYVGSGTLTRAKTLSKTTRNKRWWKVFSEEGCDVVIHSEGLTKIEAESLESQLLSEMEDKYSLTNIKKVSSNKTLRREDFEENLYYTEESRSCLRFRKQPKGRFIESLDAGHLYNNGTSGPRYSVCVNYKHYQVHRVIWALLHGECPADMLVDHIDGDGANNRLDNLRLVSPLDNNKNRAKSKSSDVPRTVVRHNHKYWAVQDESKNSLFANVDVHGEEFAKLVCCEFRKRLHDKGLLNGYTLRHLNINNEGYLPDLTDEDIMSVLKPALVEHNTSGVHGVSYNMAGFWTYRLNATKCKAVSFSVAKYGESLAKEMCIEYAHYINGTSLLPGLSLRTGRAIRCNLAINNETGTPNVGISLQRNSTKVVAQRSIKGRKFSKTVAVYNFHEMIKAQRDLGILVKEFK